MPFVNCVSSKKLADEVKEELMDAIIEVVKDQTGKPESFVMVRVQDGALLRLGSADGAAYVEVRLVGELEKPVKVSLTENICQILANKAGFASEQVYVVFDEVAGSNWGWNNRTFG